MGQNLLRIGTFNLSNFIYPNTNFYGGQRYTADEYDEKKSWIVQQLRKMDADLVGFQEVFHREALQEVIDESGLYQGAEVLVADPVGDRPTVGLVSRFPIVKHRVIERFPTAAALDIDGAKIPIRTFQRPVLSVRLHLSNTVDCTIFVVHLKSKRPLFSDHADRSDPIERAKGQARSLIVRAAEATALRLAMLDVLRNRDFPVILLGDVNDSGLSVTSQIAAGEPPLRKFDTAKKKEMWDVLLYHARDIQAQQPHPAVYYTHIHNGCYESLDHIMLSQEFVAQNPNRVGMVRQVQVFNEHLIDETLCYARSKLPYSDHGQVVVSVEMETSLTPLARPATSSPPTLPNCSCPPTSAKSEDAESKSLTLASTETSTEPIEDSNSLRIRRE